MPHLIIRPPNGTQTEFILSGESVTIGRDQNCDLHFEDGQVSRQHARIDFSNGYYFISDLGSANGTIVNGQPIEAPTPLGKHNIIDIGGFLLTFKTNTEESQITFSLIGQSAPVENQTFILPIGNLNVGRSEDNAIVLNDNSLSRNHAIIRVTHKDMAIEDLGSSNGTFVNGKKIQNQSLHPSDALRFGNVNFLVSKVENKGLTQTFSQFLTRVNNADRTVKFAIAIATLSGILLIATLSIALRQHLKSEKSAEQNSISLQATYESTIARYLAQARNQMQQEDWQAASESYQQVISRDPIHQEARVSLQKAQNNLGNQIVLQAARTSLRKNNPEDVIRKVKNILKSTYYSSEAQALHRAAVQLIIDSTIDKSIRLCSNRKWKACHQASIRILKHAPHHEQALELTQEAEKQMKLSKIAYNPWTASPKTKPLPTHD